MWLKCLFYDEKGRFPHLLTAQIASTKVETALLQNLCFNPAQRDMVKTQFRMVSNSGAVEGKSTSSPGRHV